VKTKKEIEIKHTVKSDQTDCNFIGYKKITSS